MTRKDIRTTQVAIVCDVCGRRLLRGEHADIYIAGGSRRNVCELCITRAEHEGWLREAVGGALGARRQSADDRRSLLGRLRRRGERTINGDSVAFASDEVALSDEAFELSEPTSLAHNPAAEPRHVHAIPANHEMKLVRAVELFNGSEHTRTVAGIARSLGAPIIVVRTRPERPSVVEVVAAWDLSWYRYEVDLADEAAGVRLAAQGSELNQLEPEEQAPNAAAGADGALALAA